jgi:hypothetical protein
MVILIFVILGVLIILFLLLIKYTSTYESLIFENEKKLQKINSQLNFARMRFMKGKINKDVFEQLKSNLDSEKVYLELENHNLKELRLPEVSKKTNLIMEKLSNPSKLKKTRIQRLVQESEILRRDMKILESKLLKGLITKKTFENLIVKKENDLISKETELIDFVNESNEVK